MYKLKCLSVGKTKEPWLERGLEEYQQRLQGAMEFEFVWCKTNEQLLQQAEKESCRLCLDPKGKMLTSEEFASLLFKKLEEGGTRLTFIIGAAEGLPAPLKAKKDSLISLSPLTFTHQMTRLILLEQIYRAFEIVKGSEYHK